MNKKQSILLVGLGNIGQRYLQGLLKGSSNRYFIYLYDHSCDLLDKLRKTSSATNGHKLYFIYSIEQIPEFIDLAIIATTAYLRLELVKNISSKTQVEYWIFEKVLEQCPENLNNFNKNLKKSKGAWVNTPRRAMDWYGEIKSRIKKSKIININGGNWGLACNSIHFIDLVCWINDTKLVSVDSLGLQRRWVESKREGFFEVFGELKCVFEDGAILTMNCRGEDENIVIELIGAGSEIEVHEKIGAAFFKGSNEVVNGRLEFQSEITDKLVTEILKKGKCNLTKLEDSVEMHRLLIKSLLAHWNDVHKKSDKILRIT